MYFTNNIIEIKSKNKKIKIYAEYCLDIKTVNFFLSKFPQLSSGRKNYKRKELTIAKNICLTKFFKLAKKYNARFVHNICFKKKLNKITATAILSL